jgi:hypothetical protein
MNTKTLVMVCLTIGTFIGSYGVVIFGIDPLSAWSVLGGGVGGMLGIWVGWKLGNI